MELARSLCWVMVCLPLATVSGNSDPAESVETIVVTGASRGAAAFSAPYTVNVISREQITRKQVNNLPEALADTPGVLVQKTSHGQGSPFLRGFTGYRTLTLIDGVRYNNSVYRDGPNEYFSLIDFNAIDRLELLSGPASVLYGSDAVGGTLNLQTRAAGHAEARGRFAHGAQQYRYSTADNSHLARTDIEFGVGQQWGTQLGYSRKEFGDVRAADLGVQPHTGYGEHAFDFRFDLRLNATWDFTLVQQALEQDDVWRTHATIFGRSFAGTTVGTDLVRSKDQTRRLSYLRLEGFDVAPYIDALRLTVSNQAWEEDGHRVRSNRRQLLEGFDSRMWGMDVAVESHTEFVSLRYGIDYYLDEVESRGAEFEADGRLREIKIQGPVGDDASYGLFGVYVQAEMAPLARLAVTVGSRYSDTHAEVGRFEDPATGRPAALDESWSKAVHSLRALYDLTPTGDTKFWLGLSQAFRAPNIADLTRFGASRSTETEVAAIGLEPENFLTYEIGVKTQRRRWRTNATYYYTRIHDFITSTPTGRLNDGLIEVSKTNSSSGFVHGIELAGLAVLSDTMNAFANITWIEGRVEVFDDVSTPTRIREPLSRLMPLTTNLGIDWTNADAASWMAFALSVTGDADHLSAGDRNDTERIPPGGTPGYVSVNLRARQRLNTHLELNLALENILDEAYRAHGSGSNEAGLGLKVGVRLSF